MVTRALIAVVFFAAGASSAAPSVMPAVALHEITATTAQTGICGNVVVHANAAILAALHGDAAIARAVARLKTSDFDAFGTARRAAAADLTRTSNDLTENVDRAKSETQRLRDFAAHPAGDDRSADLTAFADPLDAALEGQRRIADALAAFVTALGYRDLRDGARAAATVSFADPDDPDIFHTAGHVPTALSTPPGPAYSRESPSATLTARTKASDLDAEIAQIAADEARAAVHSERAAGGC